MLYPKCIVSNPMYRGSGKSVEGGKMGRVNLSLAVNETFGNAESHANAFNDVFYITDANTYANAYADAYSISYSDINPDTDTDPDIYSDSFTDTDAYYYGPDPDPEPHPYSHSGADAISGHSMKFLADISSESGIVYAFYKSSTDGSPANGGGGTIATPGALHEIDGPLRICTKNALHATLDINSWKGSKLWLVKMYEPVEYQPNGAKVASLKREIVREL